MEFRTRRFCWLGSRIFILRITMISSRRRGKKKKSKKQPSSHSALKSPKNVRKYSWKKIQIRNCELKIEWVDGVYVISHLLIVMNCSIFFKKCFKILISLGVNIVDVVKKLEMRNFYTFKRLSNTVTTKSPWHISIDNNLFAIAD